MSLCVKIDYADVRCQMEQQVSLWSVSLHYFIAGGVHIEITQPFVFDSVIQGTTVVWLFATHFYAGDFVDCRSLVVCLLSN